MQITHHSQEQRQEEIANKRDGNPQEDVRAGLEKGGDDIADGIEGHGHEEGEL